MPQETNTDPKHWPGCLSTASQSVKRLWFLLFLFGAYILAEVIGAYLSGSLTLLADAGHMAIDTSSIALGLFAIWIAQRPPTPEKTYGYYRAEILAALANGVALVGVAIFIFSEAWPRLWNPPEVKGQLMILIAVGGLVVNLIGLFITFSGSKVSLNLKGIWLHILADTLGSVSTVVAAFLIWQYGWHLADPILSMILAVVIVIGAGRLLLDCVNVLLEGTPKNIDIRAIKDEIENSSDVIAIHDLHVWMLTSGVIALSAHVDVKEDSNHSQILETLTTNLNEKHGIAHVTLQLEPPTYNHKQLHV